MGIQGDRDAIAKIEAMAKKKKLQPQLDRQLQAVIRAVNARMAGQPASAVYAEIEARLRAIGLEANAPNLRQVAQAIEAGTHQG